ncbi:MAG: mechanosensitive ion channel family protein [Desulfurococcales archaeon]|nr:mechanosensitive ion channel family protein [Desulfurococcales archaeon]
MGVNAERIIGLLEEWLPTITISMLILAAGLVAAVIARMLMRRNLMHRLPPYLYRPLETFTFYSILVVAGIAAVAQLGVNVSALLVAGGFAGIVVGLAAQNTLGNLIAGAMLLLEQPLRVGDPINVAGVSGVVTNINMLSTHVRTWEGPIVRIPNNKVFNETITNYVRVRARRVELTIGIHYKSPLDKAIETLKKLMEDHPFCLVNPAPEVFVEDYADSAVVLRARCWAPPQAWFATKVELMTKAKEALEKAGIVIPYPQRDIHLVTLPDEVREALTRKSDNSQSVD